MARGLPGPDSSVPVTYQINGRSLIDLATDLFGEVPVVWGRYFTSTRTGGAAEYRHVREKSTVTKSRYTRNAYCAANKACIAR